MFLPFTFTHYVNLWFLASFFQGNIPFFFFPKEAGQGGVFAYICKPTVGFSYESVGFTMGHLQLSEEKNKNAQEMPGGDGHACNFLRLGYGSHFSSTMISVSNET